MSVRNSLRVAALVIVPLAAQSQSGVSQTVPTAKAPASAKVANGKKWSPPRLPDGHPDLQGLWTNSTSTPLERPKELGNKAFFTSRQDAAAFEKSEQRRLDEDRRDGGAEADLARAYNDAWYDWGKTVVKNLRTSMIVDPANGRVPPLTPEAAKIEAMRQEAARKPPAGPEDLPAQLRCIHWSTAGPPMLPSAYNNNYRIYQVPGYVIINIEMIHDTRVIPMDGRPHLPANVPQILGDSRGRWEGDTLVVDTTNFTDLFSLRGSDRNLHLIERFTRTDEDTIMYTFTVDDPTAFTKPWAAELPFRKTAGPMYEYACHEGNYAEANSLSGARAQEREEAAALSKPK